MLGLHALCLVKAWQITVIDLIKKVRKHEVNSLVDFEASIGDQGRVPVMLRITSAGSLG